MRVPKEDRGEDVLDDDAVVDYRGWDNKFVFVRGRRRGVVFSFSALIGQEGEGGGKRHG